MRFRRHWASLTIVGLSRTSCGLFADRWVTARSLWRGRRRTASGRPARPSRSPRHPPASPRSGPGCERVAGGRTLAPPFRGRLVEDRAQVAAERLVLPGPVGRPEAVRRQQRLAGVVTGVVGDAVPDDHAREQRQLVQALLGLTQERGRPRDVAGTASRRRASTSARTVACWTRVSGVSATAAPRSRRPPGRCARCPGSRRTPRTPQG